VRFRLFQPWKDEIEYGTVTSSPFAYLEVCHIFEEMAGLSLELARLTGTSERWPYTRLDESDESAIDQLCSIVDNTELKRFEEGSGSHLCSYLDSIERGESNLQFVRLSADYSGRGPSWRIVEYHCKLANLSQSFYRCISVGQWLRTVIERRTQNHVLEIRSNVVPQQEYLMRFEGVISACLGNGCTGGFFPTSVLRKLGERPFQSCTKCALAEQLRGRAQISGGVVRFWYLEEKDVKLVDDHARLGEGSTEGEVYKILWRKGIFVKKLFRLEFEDESDSEVPPQCLSFNNEIEVAMEVSHPNIVHCFGYAVWESDDHLHCEFSVFMELLEEDLESHLQERDRRQELISYRDSLHVLLQVAEAMKHLHEKNFVHGDLKPGNILLSRLAMPHSDVKFYLVKVADFGCAQRVEYSASGTVERFNSKIGTREYTAPEVLRCRRGGAPPRYPQKVDVYSFGVVACQVLTGATCNDILDDGWSRSGVMKPDTDEDQWRPDCHLRFGTPEPDRLSLLPLIRRCWASSPESRPTFTEICCEIQTLYDRFSSNEHYGGTGILSII
jgi:hypothetical protein